MAATVDQKLLKATKFPPEFSQKVDIKKVNVEVMKKWIAGKISDILGNEDDVVIELCFGLLEGQRYVSIPWPAEQAVVLTSEPA
jgi:serine/arginine repetitive matrix protein 1